MKLSAALAGCLLVTSTALADPAAETVVLLHGLGRTPLSMAGLACALEAEGYRVVNAGYPSRTRSLEAIAGEWLPARLAAVNASDAPAKIHLVTHSMGGLVVRAWLRDHPAPANLGCVVMLAPPNAGSEIPDRLGSFPPFRWFTGCNGRRLGTAPDTLPRTLGPWRATGSPLGIIAGNGASNPVLAAIVSRPSDGKVSVASTHLAGERDHLVVPGSHPWLMWRTDVVEQVKVFLRAGAFARPRRDRGV